jgi:hypothetical protein
MTIKKRTGTLVTGTTHAGAGAVTGEARLEVGLGAAYAKVFKVEFKGDDSGVDANNTLTLTDADGREVLVATALDGGTDDSTALKTEQDYSTVGVGFYLTALETDIRDADAGAAYSATEGLFAPMLARSPVTITIESGTDGDEHRVHLFVEV